LKNAKTLKKYQMGMYFGVFGFDRNFTPRTTLYCFQTGTYRVTHHLKANLKGIAAVWSFLKFHEKYASHV
jgi:hypothetical protein